MMQPDDDSAWEQPKPDRDEALILDVEGFEGPLDVLLTLARGQKVDLTRISILQLAEQYLRFIAEARRLRLELAADYLVMAAWLAYLKSRLLLPKDNEDEEPTAEELALRLQLRLQRLEAMREAGAALMSRNRLGRDVLPRGAPEGLVLERRAVYDTTLFDLLKAYGGMRQRRSVRSLQISRRPIYALEEAIRRLNDMLGGCVDWTRLAAFVPPDLADMRMGRSALASLFAASLELARTGKAELRQSETFGPLYMRAKTRQ